MSYKNNNNYNNRNVPSRKVQHLLHMVSDHADHVRHDEFLANTGYRCGDPYPSPTVGTTAFSLPNEQGIFEGEPVYYDWGANWNAVKGLVRSEQLQSSLRLSLDQATKPKINASANGLVCEFIPYNDKTTWPWLFNIRPRLRSDCQNAMMNYFLPDETIRSLNEQMANFLQSTGENWIKNNVVDSCIVPGDEYNVHDEQVWAEKIAEMAQEVWDEELGPYLFQQSVRASSPFAQEFAKACEGALYNADQEDGGVREKLLLCGSDHAQPAFLPFVYTLAKLLSPPNTVLQIHANDQYSVVHDVTHNIVFDTCWYFCNKSAREALEVSKQAPQKSPVGLSSGLDGMAVGTVSP